MMSFSDGPNINVTFVFIYAGCLDCHRCDIFLLSQSLICSLQLKMRSAGVYLVQVQISTIRNALIPQGDILITLRIGRSSTITTFANPNPTSQLTFATSMQLNVDHSALQTQRCSLSFNGPDKKIVGIALISLPKDKNFLQNTYRLTQNQEKRAEIDVKIRIVSFDSSNPGEIRQNIQVARSQSNLPKEASKLSNDILPKIYANTLNKIQTSSNNPQSINPRSKVSDEISYLSSEERKTPKNYKVRQEDRTVQTTQSQLKRFKDQKQVYYQLYQIQKCKNQAASKFIAGLLRKISEKFPSLITVLSQVQPKKSEGQRKLRKNSINNQSIDIAKVEQLQQANRTLHRQVEEYKKIVQQMRLELTRGGKGEVKPNKPPNNFLYPGIFDADGKSSLKEKSNIKSQAASALKEELKPSECLQEIDLKKWLNVSIGQRQSIQGMLSSLIQRPAQPSQKSDTLLKKLKTTVDKSFTSLMTRKQLTKEALIAHRKQVNRAFEEMSNVI